MRILVVDDSSTMRRIIKNTLGRIGYEDVVEAENGVDGLAKMDGVELILTDWNMPVMDGLTFVNSVRADDKIKGIPIIMITTEAAKEEIVVAIKSGVNDYIIKPFNQNTLREKLNKVLGG